MIVSSVFHGLLLVFALVGFSAPSTLDRPRPVQVEIISPGDLGGVSAGKPDRQPEAAAKQMPPPEKHAEVTPTASDGRPSETVAKKQAALPPPKPKAEPPAETQKPVEKKPEPRPEPEPHPQAEKKPAPPPAPAKHAEAPRPREETRQREEKREPKRRPPPRSDDRIADLLERPTHAAQGESDFDANRIAALLNRDPTAGERPQQEGPRRAWRRPSTLEEQASGAAPDAPRREAYGAPEGRDQRMGGDDIAAFRAQISRCWSPAVGGLGGDAIIVKLRIMLNEDGTLTRPPELTNDFNSPFFRPAADSAIRAVLQCQPYRLPPEKFSQWRDMLLTFDPSRMYGG
ncbi:MAG TPA: hypothetical protein VH858_09780 [Hyphomicrobiales bacterium]